MTMFPIYAPGLPGEPHALPSRIALAAVMKRTVSTRVIPSKPGVHTRRIPVAARTSSIVFSRLRPCLAAPPRAGSPRHVRLRRQLLALLAERAEVAR